MDNGLCRIQGSTKPTAISTLARTIMILRLPILSEMGPPASEDTRPTIIETIDITAIVLPACCADCPT